MRGEDFKSDENLLKANVEAFEKHIIVSALARTRGNQVLAAKQLGTTPRVIAHRIRKYKISPEQFCVGNRDLNRGNSGREGNRKPHKNRRPPLHRDSGPCFQTNQG